MTVTRSPRALVPVLVFVGTVVAVISSLGAPLVPMFGVGGAGRPQLLQGVRDVGQEDLTTLRRLGGVRAMTHDAAVEQGGLFADAGHQGGQMALALALVHDLGVIVGVANAPGQGFIDILSHLGAASHLAEVMGVEADEIFHDQLERPFRD